MGKSMMNNRPHAEIIICKCGKKKALFGLRAEEKQNKQWDVDWAFQISEKRAHSENYVSNKIQGSFNFTDKYPGCPYCGNSGIFSCGTCGKITCWDGSQTVTCSHCGTVSNIEGTISQLETGGDL